MRTLLFQAVQVNSWTSAQSCASLKEVRTTQNILQGRGIPPNIFFINEKWSIFGSQKNRDVNHPDVPHQKPCFFTSQKRTSNFDLCFSWVYICLGSDSDLGMCHVGSSYKRVPSVPQGDIFVWISWYPKNAKNKGPRKKVQLVRQNTFFLKKSENPQRFCHTKNWRAKTLALQR